MSSNCSDKGIVWMSNTTFSQKLKRLEEVVAKLESPDVELEEGLKLLEEGVELHKQCQQMLTQTQAKITKLLSPSDAESVADETAQTETKLETATLFESEPESEDSGNTQEPDRLPF